MDPPHGGGHRYRDELCLAVVLWQDESKPEAVRGIEEHTVESVLEVVLAGARWPELRVSVSDLRQDVSQCPSKLHGLRRSMMHCRLVNRRPVPLPGVVAQQARFTVSFFLDCGGRELKVGKVSDVVVWKHHPKLVLNKFSHLFAEEVRVEVGGVMAGTLDAFVFLVVGPGC